MKGVFHPGRRMMFASVTLVVSGLVAILGAEATIRALLPQEDLIRWMRIDEKYGKVNREDCRETLRFPRSDFVMHVRTNSLGLRDREYDLTDESAKRVLLVGDSFTFGYGLNREDIFDAKLERKLRETGEKYFVINAGVNDWGTLQEVVYARDHFELFSPDVIVLTFCGNDPEGDRRYLAQVRQDFQGYFYFPGKAFLRRQSHLYRLLRSQVWALEQRLDEPEGAGQRAEAVHVDPQTGYRIPNEAWRATLATLRDFHRDFLEFNAEGVLLIQATAPWDERIRARLSSIANGENLVYVDLADEARELSPSERRLPYDAHWSERMHSISAERLFETITELSPVRRGPRLAASSESTRTGGF